MCIISQVDSDEMWVRLAVSPCTAETTVEIRLNFNTLIPLGYAVD